MVLQDIVKEINRVSIEAGQAALNYYYKPITSSTKKDKSIVSVADVEVEKLIINKLKGIIPDAVFIGEESCEHLTVEEKIQKAEAVFQNEYVWAIDPIDGTTNYISHYDDWAISIGLLKKGEVGIKPFIGSIYIPCKDKLYYTDSKKAYVVFNASKDTSIEIEIKQVTYNENDLDTKLFVANGARTKKYGLDKLKHVRYPGSLVVELASTAAGESMGTILHANIWDITAGLALCSAVGIKIYAIKFEQELKEFMLDDFIFSETKAWKLKHEYLVANESAKQLLLKAIEKV